MNLWPFAKKTNFTPSRNDELPAGVVLAMSTTDAPPVHSAQPLPAEPKPPIVTPSAPRQASAYEYVPPSPANSVFAVAAPEEASLEQNALNLEFSNCIISAPAPVLDNSAFLAPDNHSVATSPALETTLLGDQTTTISPVPSLFAFIAPDAAEASAQSTVNVPADPLPEIPEVTPVVVTASTLQDLERQEENLQTSDTETLDATGHPQGMSFESSAELTLPLSELMPPAARLAPWETVSDGSITASAFTPASEQDDYVPETIADDDVLASLFNKDVSMANWDGKAASATTPFGSLEAPSNTTPFDFGFGTPSLQTEEAHPVEFGNFDAPASASPFSDNGFSLDFNESDLNAGIPESLDLSQALSTLKNANLETEPADIAAQAEWSDFSGLPESPPVSIDDMDIFSTFTMAEESSGHAMESERSVLFKEENSYDLGHYDDPETPAPILSLGAKPVEPEIALPVETKPIEETDWQQVLNNLIAEMPPAEMKPVTSVDFTDLSEDDCAALFDQSPEKLESEEATQSVMAFPEVASTPLEAAELRWNELPWAAETAFDETPETWMSEDVQTDIETWPAPDLQTLAFVQFADVAPTLPPETEAVVEFDVAPETEAAAPQAEPLPETIFATEEITVPAPALPLTDLVEPMPAIPLTISVPKPILQEASYFGAVGPVDESASPISAAEIKQILATPVVSHAPTRSIFVKPRKGRPFNPTVTGPSNLYTESLEETMTAFERDVIHSNNQLLNQSLNNLVSRYFAQES